MWTEITRPKYERSGRRYASDATDAEWSHIAPLLPTAKRGGRPRTTGLRDVFDAILVHGLHWLSVADAAERLSAGLHGAPVFLRLARQRSFANDQPLSCHGGQRSHRVRGQSVGGRGR